MAVLITLTIGFSFVFSFGFFMAYLIMIGPEYDNGNLGFICGESLVEHAKHAVEARKVALQHWKNMRLKQMKLNGGTTSLTKKTMKNDEIEMVSVNSSNDVAVEGEEELTGNEILNWGGSVDDPTSAAGKGKQ